MLAQFQKPGKIDKGKPTPHELLFDNILSLVD